MIYMFTGLTMSYITLYYYVCPLKKRPTFWLKYILVFASVSSPWYTTPWRQIFTSIIEKTGIILRMCSVNTRRRYNATPSLTDWAPTQNYLQIKYLFCISVQMCHNAIAYNVWVLTKSKTVASCTNGINIYVAACLPSLFAQYILNGLTKKKDDYCM